MNTIFGNMYYIEEGRKIKELIDKAKLLHPEILSKSIIYVLVNRKDAEGENLSDGDIIGEFTIRPSDDVMSNYLWFIEQNNLEI
jgi:hypothetical protein